MARSNAAGRRGGLMGLLAGLLLLTAPGSPTLSAVPTGPYKVLVIRVDFEDSPGVQLSETMFQNEWLSALVAYWTDMSNGMLQLEPYLVDTVMTIGPRRIYYPCDDSVSLLPGEACTSAMEPAVQAAIAAGKVDILAGTGLVPDGSTDPAQKFDGVLVVFGQPLDYPLTLWAGAGGCGTPLGVASRRQLEEPAGSDYPGGPYDLGIAVEDGNSSCDAAFTPPDLTFAIHELGRMIARHFGNSSAPPSSYRNFFEPIDKGNGNVLGANPRMSAEIKGAGFPVQFPGWLPDENVAIIEPRSVGYTEILSPIEWDPDIATSPQALRVGTADGTIHIVECRRELSWDAVAPIRDTGVLILTLVPGASPSATFRMPPTSAPFAWGDPDSMALWKNGNIFFDFDNDLVIEIGPDSGDGCTVTVEYGLEGLSAVPDVGLIPWQTPPRNTWETIDIWVDSPCNGYEDEGGLLRRGRDADGNVIYSGDDLCANRTNRIYAKIRNFGTMDATDVSGRILRTLPLGVGIGDAAGWVDIGSFGPIPLIPRNSDATIYVEWTPEVVPPVPDGEVFPFQVGLQVVVNPVAGERIIANQDGFNEQELLTAMEVRRDPVGSSYAPGAAQITLTNHEDLPGDFLVSVNPGLPPGWGFGGSGFDGFHHLMPGESVTLPITVQAPAGAPIGERHAIEVTGFRRQDFIDPETGDFLGSYEPMGGVVILAETVLDTGLSVNGAGSPPDSCAAQAMDVAGCLSQAVAGTLVSIDLHAPDGSVQSSLATTDASGCFVESLPVSSTGDWGVQAFWHGDTTHGSARSSLVQVPVHDPDDVDCDQVAEPGDNCPGLFNPQQADTDQDGAGDACDCNPQDGGAWLLPPEVTGVRFLADQIALAWDSLGPVAGWSTLYDVTRGLVSELPTGAGLSETCLAQQIQDTTAYDQATPGINEAAWFFVQAVNSCGYGPPGASSSGVPWQPAACGVCPHDLCTQGGALDGSCGDCAAQICGADPYCCTDAWDSICIDEVQSVCGSSQCLGN